MTYAPRPVGRPPKKGEVKKSFGMAVVPSRIQAFDFLVDHFKHESRGDLLTEWIDREMQAVMGDDWVEQLQAEQTEAAA